MVGMLSPTAPARSKEGSLLAICLLLAACGGSARVDKNDSPVMAGASGGAGIAGMSSGGTSSGGTSSGGSASAGTSSAASAGVACPVGIPSAPEIASTPRANTNLELLALKFSTNIVAEQAIYDRLVRDVGAIDAVVATVAGIAYFPPYDGRALLLSIDAEAFSEMQQKRYTDWDCLNQAYVTKRIDFSPATVPGFSPFVTLTLKGIYELTQVAAQYAALRGIKSAGPNTGGGDGPTICVKREGDLWHYVFDQASGDCLAGCIDHVFTHFTTNAAGAVTPLGGLSPALAANYCL